MTGRENSATVQLVHSVNSKSIIQLNASKLRLIIVNATHMFRPENKKMEESEGCVCNKNTNDDEEEEHL